MIDKAATHEADHTTFDTTVDAVDTHSPDAGKAENSRSGGARFALFIALLALSFTAIGIAAGYKHWQRMNDRARTNAAEIETLRQQLQAVPANDALDSLRKEVAAKTAQSQTANDQVIQEMARIQNQTRQFADTVASQVEQVTFLQAKMQQSAAPASASEWQIAEVDFLLKLAIRQVHLAQDTRTAITALKEADALLAKAGSVNYLPVRQQVARDISTLEAVAVPDISAISQQITGLMLGLKPLPALNTSPVADKAEASAPPVEGDDTDASIWAGYKRKALDALDQAIVIRQHDQPIQMQMDADARLNLFQLLHLRLETLRLLVLQRDNTSYRAQLDVVRETLRTYYPAEQAKPLLSELDALGKHDLQPAIPDISASLKQLESARHAEAVQGQAAPEVAPVTTDAPVDVPTNAKAEAKPTDKVKKEGGKRE
ncbi:MAG: hypothetical protein RL122_2507 [Pseudomonadota bacterium]|jgi:uncharacterized protein HemX